MRRDFEAQLALGNMGELLVSRWLQSQGCGVLPGYDFSGGDGEKAPRLHFSDGGKVIPDLDVCRSGGRFWVEVKTFWAPAHNRSRGMMVHGVKARLLNEYAEVERATGTPVFVFVLEVESGVLLSAALKSINRVGFACQCGGCRQGRCFSVPRAARYWPRSAMAPRHQFSEAEMSPLRTDWLARATT